MAAEFREKFYGDLSVGVVAHNGTTRLEFMQGETIPEFLLRADKEIAFGTLLLFREQIALGFNIDDSWSTEVFFEHLSNAYTSSVNEGADNLGFRVVRKF